MMMVRRSRADGTAVIGIMWMGKGTVTGVESRMTSEGVGAKTGMHMNG